MNDDTRVVNARPNLTVGDLRELIQAVPDDTPVWIEFGDEADGIRNYEVEHAAIETRLTPGEGTFTTVALRGVDY